MATVKARDRPCEVVQDPVKAEGALANATNEKDIMSV